MSYKAETPFDSIEGSHEYVALLAETIEEVRLDVEAEIARASEEKDVRRKEALQLVSHNLTKLSMHLTSGRRILNDLRTLRRLLLAERDPLTGFAHKVVEKSGSGDGDPQSGAKALNAQARNRRARQPGIQ